MINLCVVHFLCLLLIIIRLYFIFNIKFIIEKIILICYFLREFKKKNIDFLVYIKKIKIFYDQDQ